MFVSIILQLCSCREIETESLNTIQATAVAMVAKPAKPAKLLTN